MKNGIQLSEKHGVNPSMNKCFWCGEVKELILFGRMKGDKEAPREVVMNLEPCEKCKKMFAQGVLMVEVTKDGSRFNNSPRFGIKSSEGGVFYPTGRFCVLKEGATKYPKGSSVLTDIKTMDMILSENKEEKK